MFYLSYSIFAMVVFITSKTYIKSRDLLHLEVNTKFHYVLYFIFHWVYESISDGGICRRKK